MAKSKWSLASYNRFIGEGISKYGLTRKESAQLYREMKQGIGHPVFRNDIKKHPGITERIAKEIVKEREREKSIEELLSMWDSMAEDSFDYDQEYDGTFEY